MKYDEFDSKFYKDIDGMFLSYGNMPIYNNSMFDYILDYSSTNISYDLQNKDVNLYSSCLNNIFDNKGRIFDDNNSFDM